MIKNVKYLLFFLFFQVAVVSAQKLPSPKEHFGFNIGDNYQLANYTQTQAYFKKIATASDKVKLINIGKTEEGRDQCMLIVSSPENLKKSEYYRAISQKLARAEGISDEDARKLAKEGKSIVWIDGGLHGTEVVATHQLIETVWQAVSRTDDETRNILNNVIILFVHANPDGQELVSNWYMKDADTAKRKFNIPRMYQKYVGHDNNRDFFMMNMQESRNISKQLFVEWIPQIMYNHHQRGPAGTVVVGPPYRDPFNYVYDPLLITSLDGIGAAINGRFNVEGKKGYAQRSGSKFSTWWNGGLRTTPYFHNIIGILTEIIGGPTPEDIPLVPGRLIPNGDSPNPITPQKWYFRQSIDYSVSINYAVLNYAATNKSDLLYNIYKMGRNSIEKGSKDNWTLYPKYIDSIKESIAANKDEKNITAKQKTAKALESYNNVFANAGYRDARAYIISSEQADFPTAVKFINALIWSGIKVHQAEKEFRANGKTYPAGSYIVKTAQAFRPHVIDMFEPQDHPNDFQYEGGPPISPYDAAGWTLALQMGVKFDRVMEEVSGQFLTIPYGEIQSAPKRTILGIAKSGYLISPRENDAFFAVNKLLKGGEKVFRVTSSNQNVDIATFYVPGTSKAKNILEQAIREKGISVTGTSKKPNNLVQLSPLRIGIFNRYGGSMPSGWLSWIFEQYDYSYSFIYPQEIDGGNLTKKYDVIIFPNSIMPEYGKKVLATKSDVNSIPAEFVKWTGRISTDKSIPQIKQFIEEGGTVITTGNATNLAYHLNLPVKNHLTEKDKNGVEKPLPNTRYFIPGSILKVDIADNNPAAYGMFASCDIYFDKSPLFKIEPSKSSGKENITPLMWFTSDKPLLSGWAWGQSYVKDGVAAFSADVGKGKLYAFGPQIGFRAQSQATFKLYFNQLYRVK